MTTSQHIKLTAIMRVVTIETGIRIEDIIGPSRKAAIRDARHLFVYIAVQVLNRKLRDVGGFASLESIGKYINRKHCTMMHSVEVIENYIFTQHNFAEMVKVVMDKASAVMSYDAEVHYLTATIDRLQDELKQIIETNEVIRTSKAALPQL
jgi:hypothetical protein